MRAELSAEVNIEPLRAEYGTSVRMDRTRCRRSLSSPPHRRCSAWTRDSRSKADTPSG